MIQYHNLYHTLVIISSIKKEQDVRLKIKLFHQKEEHIQVSNACYGNEAPLLHCTLPWCTRTKKGKLGAYAMKRVAAKADLSTPRLLNLRKAEMIEPRLQFPSSMRTLDIRFYV